MRLRFCPPSSCFVVLDDPEIHKDNSEGALVVAEMGVIGRGEGEKSGEEKSFLSLKRPLVLRVGVGGE